MRLAWKLIAAIAAGTIAIVAVYGYLAFRRETELIESSTRDNLSAMGRALRPAMAEVWARDGQQRALEVVRFADEQLRRVDIRWVRLDAPPGSADAPAVPAARLEPVRHGEEVALVSPLGHDRFYAYVPVQVATGAPGALELVQSLERERRFVRDSVRNVLVTTIALAAGAGLLVLLLGTWLVGRPMQRLVLQARRIGVGDFATRLGLRQRDEIGEVGREMDFMCERLQQAKEAIAAETAARLEAMDQLRHAERLATIGRLAAGMAHEINTPLTVIGGRASLIAEAPATDARVREGAVTIRAQVGRIAAIVRQMLDFARVRGGHKEAVEPRTVVGEVLRLVGPEASKRHVTLAVEDGAAGGCVWADAGQLQQVITNLVVNAIQAMPDGGTATVALRRERRRPRADRTAAAAEHVAVEVADQGLGIPPENLESIFEPFYTTKGVGEGTGLGLSVAHGIVEEHGGWIDVESTMGKGSRFTVWLPLHLVTETPVAAAAGDPSSGTPAPGTHHAETAAELPPRGGSV